MKFRKGWIAGVMLVLAQGAAAELTNGLYATFDTTMGSFTCRLDYAEAPLTCANFVGLAEGSQSWVAPQTGGVQADPFYDDLIFHRVITNFMIQGGCPLGNGTSGPGYAFPDEFIPTTNHYETAGTLVMANSGPDSNGSQIFITVVPYPNLDASKYMVFGNVVDGIEVVMDIGNVATTGPSGNPKDRPLVDVVMNSIQILRVGDDALDFDPVDQPLPEVTPLNLEITNGISGMEVVAATSNQCELTVYTSTNLQDWVVSSNKYWSVGAGDWVVPASTNHTAEFFRGTHIFYPQAVPDLSEDITGHQLEFVQGTNSIVFNPQAEGVGTCVIAGTPDEIINWEWSPSIWSAFIQVWTASGYNLVFEVKHDAPGNGNWNGHYYNLGWNYTGEWSFSNAPASSE